jgi:hypothetical protein
LRLIIISVTLAVVVALLVVGYLQVFTDYFVLRGTPVQRLLSPEGDWELRVYEVADGYDLEEHGGVWLAAVIPADDPEAEQRPVYYGAEVTFTWIDDRTLSAREYPTDEPGAEHRLNVLHGSYGVEDRWADDQRGVLFAAAFIVLIVPAGLALVIGIAAALFLPRLLWRGRATPSTSPPAVGGGGVPA